MATALVGHTGFVGGTLLRQQPFDDLYNSKNIESIAGKRYETVVCAGMPAEKWKANQQPENDRENTQRLMDEIGQVSAERFVLISTVDVYASPYHVDEQTPIDDAVLQPYGLNRHRLETFVAERFSSYAIVRLPGLFGVGLKKNFLFDMLRSGESAWTDHRSRFQFYDMSRLWNDLETALRQKLSVVNFATPPVEVAEIARRSFGASFTNETANPPVHYDMRTRFAPQFGGEGHYLYSAGECFERIADFVKGERAGGERPDQ
jgi:nucleoside-diphosphate-sugar epimerase